MMTRLLVANRGEIAVRILRTCRKLGIECILAASEADAESGATEGFDRVVCIGPSRATASYLNREALLTVALNLDCEAIHPGYGFLAEDAHFAEMCAQNSISFIGPNPAVLELFGDKVSARRAAEAADVPIVPGSVAVTNPEEARRACGDLGYPVMLKAARGGGGKGMRIVRSESELATSLEIAMSEAGASFGSREVFVERWIAGARHVEVQIVGAQSGEIIHMADRDCSVQRRHQKLIEEAPAPSLDPSLQQEMRESAVRLCRHVGMDNAATVEFLYDPRRRRFYFLEVNPRLQVEHGVTELVTGQDIVELQLRASHYRELRLKQDNISVNGVAIECRLNAEDPLKSFAPSPGRISNWEMPSGASVRVDSHCYAGYFVPPYYDSLVAKLMVHGSNRAVAIRRMSEALESTSIVGAATTLDLARWIIAHDDYANVQIDTRWLDGHLTDGSWIGS